MNVSLYGKIGLSDIKDLETRSSWIVQMGSKSNDRRLYERKAEGIKRMEEKVTQTQAEAGAM